MYKLVDRASGDVICEAQESDMDVLLEHLVRESTQDYDFYLNRATLDFLEEKWLSQSVVADIGNRLNERGLDLGWENGGRGAESLYSGSVVDDEGQPLGGIRVDLLDTTPLKTGKLQRKHTVVDWTYSRADGSFALGLDSDSPGTEFRFSGRGDLVLSVAEVDTLGEQGEFVLQTITGLLKLENGDFLPGASVQLLNWVSEEGHDADHDTLGGSLSWGDCDEQGRFAIPAHLPDDQGEVTVSLEVLSLYGESLLETEIVLDPSEGLDIGELVATTPHIEFGEEEFSPEEARNRPFEHPLS